MPESNVISPFWFSLVMVICFGTLMFFDTIKRIIDEEGCLYEIEYRSSTTKSQATIRLISGLMVLYFLFQLTQGYFYTNDGRLLIILPILFSLLYVRTYSREQNFTSLYFKDLYLCIGFSKYRYSDIQLVQKLGRVEIINNSDGKAICVVPSKYFNKNDFYEFIENQSFQEKLVLTTSTDK